MIRVTVADENREFGGLTTNDYLSNLLLSINKQLQQVSPGWQASGIDFETTFPGIGLIS